MSIFRRVNPALAAVAAVALVAALIWVLIPHTGNRYVVADYPKTIALYQGSDVKILGVTVGKVDSVTPMGTFVRVRFSYSDQYKVPANAKAVVISPSIVGDRFVQLTPAYTHGAVLADNAHLGLKRTATPLELDTIFGSLNNLDVALGPAGANSPDSNGEGALSRLLDVTARNFGGEGVQFNQTIHNLSRLTKTLADNKTQLFGTAQQIERFTGTLARNDTTVRRFADSLSSGSALLASDRKDLGAALDNLAVALTEVRGFVKDNRAALTSNISGLTRLSNTIVSRRAALDSSLHDAPAALNNLFLAYDPNRGTLDTRANVGETLNALSANPVQFLCSFLNKQTIGVACPLQGLSGLKLSGLGRAAPFGEGSGSATSYDPTLAGLIGGRR